MFQSLKGADMISAPFLIIKTISIRVLYTFHQAHFFITYNHIVFILKMFPKKCYVIFLPDILMCLNISTKYVCDKVSVYFIFIQT